MIRALLLCAIATPACADRYDWGEPKSSYVETFPGEGMGHVATLTLHNTRTFPILGEVTFVLSEAGLVFAVTVQQGPGDVPDTLIVSPPDGFIAIPPSVDVPEGGEGSIDIFDASEVPLG